MKEIRCIILVIFSIFTLESCSFLTRVSSLENKKSKGWIEGNFCHYCQSFGGFMSYDYRYKMTADTSANLSISICPCLQYYSITFGPPLIPLIPNPNLLFLKKDWDAHPFYIDIMFLNFKNKTIDIKSLEYSINKSKKIVSPSRIELLENKILRNEEGVNVEKLTDYDVFANSDTLKLRVYFDLRRNNVKQFSIKFDKFVVDEKIVRFPTLNLKRKSKFLYDPLVIGS